MLPPSNWYRGNPHYDSLFRANTPQQRLQRQVLEALLNAMPEAAAAALLAELLDAKHPGQVQAVRIAELTQGMIDAVLTAAVQHSQAYRLHGHEVRMVPVERLRCLTDADFMQPPTIHDC